MALIFIVVHFKSLPAYENLDMLSIWCGCCESCSQFGCTRVTLEYLIFLKFVIKWCVRRKFISISLWYCELFVMACIIISLNNVWYLVQFGWVSIGCPHQYDYTSWYTQIPINLSSVAGQTSATPANHTSATAEKCCWRRRSSEC